MSEPSTVPSRPSRRAMRRARQRARQQPAGPPTRRTRPKWLRWTLRGSAVVAGLVIVGLLTSAAYITAAVIRSRPTVSGEVGVSGLTDRVEIFRDAHGIPTIVASNAEDLWFAQGYVHAQDRFWEMDFRRHVTAGRLSELFGASQVGTDAFIRTLGWRRTAEQELATFDEETVTMLDAYAAGVNAWLEGRRGTRLSLEHSLLPLTGARGYHPEPWTPVDSVAWIKAMAWDLSTVEDDLDRARLSVTDLGPGRQWQDLYPSPPDEHLPILPDGGQAAGTPSAPPLSSPATARRSPTSSGPREAAALKSAVTQALMEADELADLLATTQAAIRTVPQHLGSGDLVGSNSWVIAPQRSASGGALLANDPHLEPSQPSLWYQVGLRCEPVGRLCPYHVTGFSFAGMPGVIIGRTDQAAWGLTNLAASTAELVVERLDGDQYLTVGNRWHDVTTHTETIAVAGGSDVEVVVRRTRHGPLISDVFDEAERLAQGPMGNQRRDNGSFEHAIALRWTALEPTTTVEAIPRFARLRDWDDFEDATRRFQIPSQSVVYADVHGNIGYRGPGLYPLRRGGDGYLPVAGWTGASSWDGAIDYDQLPWVLNPDDGIIVAANQDTLPAGNEPVVTRDPSMGFRSQRIYDLLDQHDVVSLDAMIAMQLDTHNANAEVVVPALLAVDNRGMRSVSAVQTVLESWDYLDTRDSAGAAAFNATWRHLLALTFHDELPTWAHPNGSGRWWRVVHLLLDQPESAWWDDLTTLETETRDDILLAAMADAFADLSTEFGEDPARWRWGALHTLELRHATFGSSGIGVIERLFNRGPYETDGGSDVVNAIGWDAAEGYEVSRVPSMRMLLDLSDPDGGRWVHFTGQSGRPFSRHYTDQVERWQLGEYLPMTTSSAAARQTAHDRLLLQPQR